MGERSQQRTRSVDDAGIDDALLEDSVGPEVDAGPDADEPTPSATASATDRLRDRLASPFGGYFSVRAFLLLFTITAVGMFLASTVLPLGSIAGLLGIATVAFVVGVVDDQRRYLEFALSGAASAGIGWLLGNLLLTALGVGVPLVAVGVGAGLLSAVVGHYFGRDLRAGLTKDV